MRIALLFLLMLSACAVNANVNKKDNDIYHLPLEQLLELTIYRASLEKATQIKLNAVNVQDSIVAEDIADFPDLNLAEAIQRMPGVAITREGNEGRQISLRGIGPDFSRVQINGMEVMAKTSSPMDSRRAVTSDRSFDFNIFSSDMFSQIDIYKSYYAKLDEGGIGGTVGLLTPKPFDHDKPVLGVSVFAGSNTLTSDTSPRITTLLSNTWGRFGSLLSISYSERDIVERGYNTFRWRQRSTTNYSDTLAPELAQDLENGELWFARGNRYSVWENTQERIGANLALQFKPNDKASLGLTLFHVELNNDRNEWHLDTLGSSNTALGRVEDLEIRELNGHKEVIYGEFSELTLRTESRIDQADTEFQQYVFDLDWQLTDKLKLTGLLGWAKSDFDQPVSDKVYYQTREPAGIITDFRSNRFYPTHTYSVDTTDPSLWRVRELDLREDRIVDEFDNWQLDFQYDFSDSNNLQFGLNDKKYTNSYAKWTNDNFISSQSVPLNSDSLDLTPFLIRYNGSADANWLAADVVTAQRFYGIDTQLDRSNFGDKGLIEDTMAAYLQYNHEYHFMGREIRSNIGVRFFQTDVTMKANVNGQNISATSSYSDVLPSFNFLAKLTESIGWRVNVSKNISRAELGEQALEVSLDTENQIVEADDSNVNLKPFESLSFETSLEYYLGENGFVSLTFFQHNIKNFTETITSIEPYSVTGLPESLLADGQSINTSFEYSRLENTQDEKIMGLELTLNQSFYSLPEPFKYFGVLSNLTLVDGNAVYNDVQGTGESVTKKFIGLSEVSGNFSLYYERGKWGGALLGAYRDDYISRVSSGNRDEDERGFHSTFNMDMKVYYSISENLRVSVEGTNLTGEREEQYSDSNDRPYNITESGTTYYIGMSYKF